MPSVHVRAVVTWLAIFPMVAVGKTLMNALPFSWPPVLLALALTAVVVPTAVYLAVPGLLLRQARLTEPIRRRRERRIQAANLS